MNYPLYGDDAVNKISDYLAGAFGTKYKPDMHNHKKDIEHGVSPHMLKCTRSDGKIVEMGICRISID